MTYEMPVIARLTREELAASLGKPLDDPEIALLDGMTVVIHPADSHHVPTVGDVQAAMPEVSSELAEVAEAVAGIEEALFARIRSNPAAAKRFVLDPLEALASFGLIDAEQREKLEAHRATVSKSFAGA